MAFKIHPQILKINSTVLSNIPLIIQMEPAYWTQPKPFTMHAHSHDHKNCGHYILWYYVDITYKQVPMTLLHVEYTPQPPFSALK